MKVEYQQRRLDTTRYMCLNRASAIRQSGQSKCDQFHTVSCHRRRQRESDPIVAIGTVAVAINLNKCTLTIRTEKGKHLIDPLKRVVRYGH